MLDVQIESEAIRMDNKLAISFKRTLRIPEDGSKHKPPPNFGVFPIYRVGDHAQNLPVQWQQEGGVFIPMYQREGLYIRFENATPWQPYAVKVSLGGINAISGQAHDSKLRADPQDYLVCPPQLWLDGIYTGRSTLRQFVAMPLGAGYTVEEALSASEKVGGLQIVVFAPRPEIFPDAPPKTKRVIRPTSFLQGSDTETPSMGLAAGGNINEKILPDPYGCKTWDQNNFAELRVHILNSAQFKVITGLEPPPTTINEETYAEHEFPWFPLYGDVLQGDVRPSDLFAEVKTVAETDAERDQDGKPPSSREINA
jgi:hypothetical protein